jgi:hypothetical protein
MPEISSIKVKGECEGLTYHVLHATRPHAVELVVRYFGGGLGELGNGLDHILNGLSGCFKDARNCRLCEFALHVVKQADSRSETGVECALERTNEMLRAADINAGSIG